MKTFIIFIFWIYCCLFLFYPAWRINIWANMSKILWHLKHESWTESKIKSLLIDLSKSFCYLEKYALNSLSTTSFTLSELINSVLLPFACITCFFSASFEEIKLIAIVNWIFDVSDSTCPSILLVISFYFYHHYCHIQYNIFSKKYLHFLDYNNHLLVQKGS